MKRRGIKAALLGIMLSVTLAVSVALSACGPFLPGDGSSTTEPGDDGPVILSIEQALAVEPGESIRVQGSIFVTKTEVILASAMAESYPPKPGGATLVVEGLSLDALVGLSTTAGQAGIALATWSDYSVVLEGVVNDGVLQVRATPRVIEAASTEARVRFSPVGEPLTAEDTIWWAFDVKNVGPVALSLTFSSGQRGEVILSQGGVEKYRWSAGKAFTEAIETVTLGPGATLPMVLNDRLQVPPGVYDLVAAVTASVGSEGAAETLPELTGTITVH